MSYESFNIRPGMSCWTDMPQSYKNAYHEKFSHARFEGVVQVKIDGGEESPVANKDADWRSPRVEPEVVPEIMPKVEPNEISEEPDWRSSPNTLTESVIELVEEVDVTCSPGNPCDVDECTTCIENPCPVCGNELPKGKKYCTRKCFYNRNK